jgi:DNA-directed RNA polymerase sigma subunit (sigma70/sigma32)
VADPDHDVAETAIARIDAARARRQVRSLPMLERKVIIWRYGLLGEFLTCREVAERLGMSKANAVAIEKRALARLRAWYEDEHEAA